MCSNENYVGPPSEKKSHVSIMFDEKVTTITNTLLSDDLPYAYYTTHCAMFF